jgi:hypothetical protein
MWGAGGRGGSCCDGTAEWFVQQEAIIGWTWQRMNMGGW